MSHFAAAMLISASVVGQLANRESSIQDIRIQHCILSTIDEARVSAKEKGILVVIPVKENDKFVQDDLLAQIDDADAKQTYLIARFEYAAAKRESENTIREQAATAQAAVAGADVDEATDANTRVSGTFAPAEVRRRKLEHNNALLSIELQRHNKEIARLDTKVKLAQATQAQEMIKRRKVLAPPYEGVVNEIYRKIGEWVNPGDPIMHVVRLSQLRVEGFVSVADYSQHEIRGARVTVDVFLERGRKEQALGRVTFVSPTVEADGSFRVRAEIENPTVGDFFLFSPGQPAEMTIHLNSAIRARRSGDTRR